MIPNNALSVRGAQIRNSAYAFFNIIIIGVNGDKQNKNINEIKPYITWNNYNNRTN